MKIRKQKERCEDQNLHSNVTMSFIAFNPSKALQDKRIRQNLFDLDLNLS